MLDLEYAFSQVGALGICQVVSIVVAALFMSLVAANMASSIFEAMVPETRCKSPTEDDVIRDCPVGFQKFLVPEIDGVLSKCTRYNFTDIKSNILPSYSLENSTSNCNITINHTGIDIVPCTAWDFNRTVMRDTIVTDFNLVCGDQWAVYFSTSALMIGIGIGSIVAGYVSDSIGRRHALLLAFVGTTIFGIGLSFTTSYLEYSIVRGILGLFLYAPFPILFVLASELTIPKYRSVVAQVLEVSFPIGFMLLSLVAYQLREWRHIQLAISVPFAAGILLWWFIPESPRWLCEKNREDDAIKVFQRIAKMNRNFKPLVFKNQNQGADDSRVNEGVTQPYPEEKTSMKSLFKLPHLRSATLKLFYNWFAISSVYYGLTFNSAELDGDPFRNVCLNAVAEIIGVIMTIPLANFFGRRATASATEILAGVICILLILVPNGAVLAFAIAGKFAITISFSVMYIHTNEIYPTVVRNLGVGLCSAAARIGGVASPLIVMAGIWAAEVPYVVFGMFSITSGIVVLALPETKGTKLPQTFQEGEALVAGDRGILPRICSMQRQNPQKDQKETADLNTVCGREQDCSRI